MKPVLFLSLAAALLTGCDRAPTEVASEVASDDTGMPTLAATAFTSNQNFPIALTAFIPCANGGAGEEVTLTGNLHVLFHVTISNSGNVTFKSHFQPQGITGAGAVTGAKYQGTGVTQDVNTGHAVGRTFMVINNFRIIGQGPGNNFLVHQNIHATVNANGTITAVLDNFRVACR